MGTTASKEKAVVLTVGGDREFYKEVEDAALALGHPIRRAAGLLEMIYEIHEDEKANLAVLIDRNVDKVFAALNYLENVAHRCMGFVVVGEKDFHGFEHDGVRIGEAPFSWDEQWARVHTWALRCNAYNAFLKEGFDVEAWLRIINFSPVWKRLAEVVKDNLTGLLNAQGFERTVVPLLESMRDRRSVERFYSVGDEHDRRHHNPTVVSILMGDADRFKPINDTYGHLVGDEAIIFMANTLASEMRPADILARRSGDEFMLCFPGFTLEQAEQKAADLQAKFNNAVFYGREKERVPLSMSFGAVEIHGFEVGAVADAVLEKIIEKADLRLIAKKSRTKRG